MKAFVILAMLAIGSTQAMATSLAPLVCTNGKIGPDGFHSVTLLNGSAKIEMHESEVTANSSETVVNGNTVAILNKELELTSEGEYSVEMTNALMVYKSEEKTLIVTLIMNGETKIAAEEMTCK